MAKARQIRQLIWKLVHDSQHTSRLLKVVLVEKRQALLNVVCDVDTNAGGD